MTAETLVAQLEQVGVLLIVEGDKLRLQAPPDKVPLPETIAELRENKTAVLEYLRERVKPAQNQFSSFPTPRAWQTEKLECWPAESVEAERRFGQPHARLFPFIGRKVRTPGGPGTLLQVFAERVTVLLDSELSRCAFFQPGQVEPLSKELDS
jgi:hypothetical protein